MTIEFIENAAEITVIFEGRLDTSSSPELEAKMGEALLPNITDVIMDFEKLAYISSAGLRVLLGIQKKMNARKGSLTIKHANEMVMEVFEVTGFIDILTVEND